MKLVEEIKIPFYHILIHNLILFKMGRKKCGDRIPYDEKINQREMQNNIKVMNYYRLYIIIPFLNPNVSRSEIPIVPYNAYTFLKNKSTTYFVRRNHSHSYWKLITEKYKYPFSKIGAKLHHSYLNIPLLCLLANIRVTFYMVPENGRRSIMQNTLGTQDQSLPKMSLEDFLESIKVKCPIIYPDLVQEAKQHYQYKEPSSIASTSVPSSVPSGSSDFFFDSDTDSQLTEVASENLDDVLDNLIDELSADEDIQYLADILHTEDDPSLPASLPASQQNWSPQDPTPEDLLCPWEYNVPTVPTAASRAVTTRRVDAPRAVVSSRPRRQAFVAASKRIESTRQDWGTELALKKTEQDRQIEEDRIRYGPPEPPVIYNPYQLRIHSTPKKRKLLQQILGEADPSPSPPKKKEKQDQCLHDDEEEVDLLNDCGEFYFNFEGVKEVTLI